MKKLWTSPDDNKPQKNFTSHTNRAARRDEHLDEFYDDKTLNVSASRRDFLKLFGFSIASAAVAASCEQPVRKAIPFLIQPETVKPGKSNYYASTFFDGTDYCSILVKVRDGRPIKIEGNDLSPVTMGGTSARVQASVLNLYDDARYRHPSLQGEEISWENIDAEIKQTLRRLTDEGKEMALVTPSIISPSTQRTIDTFLGAYPGMQQISYDSSTASGMLAANKATFGKELIPSYHFDRAELIMSFGADFLGTWLSPIEFTRQYAKTRSFTEGQKKLSQHIQFEANLSLTGSNADMRVTIRPSQEKAILANIYNALARKKGLSAYDCPESPIDAGHYADKLLHNSGKSLVISGSNDPDIQILVNALNSLLGNYSGPIDLSNPMLHKKGSDPEMNKLIEKLKNEELGGVIFYDTNPVYDHPKAELIRENLNNCELSVALSCARNETAELVKYNCPDNHYLESWNDYEIRRGKYSFAQPAIAPLFNTRQAQESLLRWAGIDNDYHSYLKEFWEKERPYDMSAFDFWNKCLHDGIYDKVSSAQTVPPAMDTNSLSAVFRDFETPSGKIELITYEKVSTGNGRYANNPWLQEMPDPVSKITWDNYLCIAPSDAKNKGWKTGDLISLNGSITLPALVQPGQAAGTVAAALGYGRTSAGIVAEGVGKNISRLLSDYKAYRSHWISLENLEKTGEGYALAQTQTHHSMEGRAIIREALLAEYLKDPSAGNDMHEEIEKHHTTLYKKHEYKGHHWGLAVDLNKCVGCSACLIACSAENNVPVVGKKEVLRVHEMHWIRIDRYYEGNADNPKTIRQPVMCQHCDNAPCENVCPVAATNHSDEGINQMAYNRCIGTRYCNNNCPYKVRRFNWFDYTTADALKGNTYDPAGMTVDLRRMVLNPDVTVRSKGVIEKCSLCVQRIQEKKLTAKLENRRLRDGEIQTACQQACPANAIVFGDMNDPESKVSKLFADPRNYHLLEELHTLPSVGYLTKITNTEKEI